MNTPSRHKWPSLALLALLASACGGDQRSGPPSIRYGQDVCSECGMIVSDERFASAIVEASAEGALLFDDVGCMIDYERKNPAVAKPHYYHDASTHQWIPAEQALFVKTTRHTPMGSGIFVFATRPQAEALAREEAEHGGTITTYSQLLHEPASTQSE